MDHTRTGAILKPVGFPRLICNIVLGQHTDILKAEDGKRELVREKADEGESCH